jgi:hypothetical protein
MNIFLLLALWIVPISQTASSYDRPYYDYTTGMLYGAKNQEWKPVVHLTLQRSEHDLLLEVELVNDTTKYVNFPPINSRTCWMSCQQQLNDRLQRVPIQGSAGNYVKYGKEDICKLAPGNSARASFKIPGFYVSRLAPTAKVKVWFEEVIRLTNSKSFVFKATSSWVAVPGLEPR